MSPGDDHRKSWNRRPAAPGINAPRAPASGGSVGSCIGAILKLIRILIVLGAIGGAGWAAWHYGAPLWNKMRLNADVESAGVFFVRAIPKGVPGRADLDRAVAAAAEEKLKTYLSQKARWLVAYGTRGDSAVVYRDQSFSKTEREFVLKMIDDAAKRNDPPGAPHETLKFPLGGWSQAITVGTETWYVVAGWCE